MDSPGINKASNGRKNLLTEKEPDLTVLEEKVQELIKAIHIHQIDSKKSKQYQHQIAEAFKRSANSRTASPFEAIPVDTNLSREELLDELEKVLAENEIDSEQSKTFLRRNAMRKGVLFIVSILLIITGFAMIIMPAPPSFEIFTVFYFNANDGITIMDLVSLLIIFGGVFLFVLNFGKK
jgi:hypothetical protein